MKYINYHFPDEGGAEPYDVEMGAELSFDEFKQSMSHTLFEGQTLKSSYSNYRDMRREHFERCLAYEHQQNEQRAIDGAKKAGKYSRRNALIKSIGDEFSNKTSIGYRIKVSCEQSLLLDDDDHELLKQIIKLTDKSITRIYNKK